jgi:hypothetical protein
MIDIKLDEQETALFNEVGSRGDYFRAATRDRAFEQVRRTGQMIEIVSATGRMLDNISITEPVPESISRTAAPSQLEAASDRNDGR